MSADILSDVLRAVHLSGGVFFDIRARAPWVAEAPAACEIAPLVMPRADHVIEYHLVVRGTCYASVVGEEQHRLEAGDVIVFPQGDAHVLASEPGMRAHPDLSVFHKLEGVELPIVLKEGGSGEPIEVICGFLGCQGRPFNPLLKALPRVLLVRNRELTERALWPLIQLAVAESKERRTGSERALSHLSELLFLEAVRAHLAALPEETRGWLPGLRETHVGHALALMHSRPAQPWSLDELAREVGLSKTILHERFIEFVGCPPIQYLTEWRMQLAAERLQNSSDTIAEIALYVGYGSESALSRAFKRLVGVSPAMFRATPAHERRAILDRRSQARLAS